jgi:hypothetical protein
MHNSRAFPISAIILVSFISSLLGCRLVDLLLVCVVVAPLSRSLSGSAISKSSKMIALPSSCLCICEV